MHHIRWDERAGAAANASRKLPGLVTWYFAHVRRLLAKDPSPPKLHRLRLATKRLRYTLELFRSCYGPGFETRMGELRDVQQLLGEINDCVEARRLLSKTMKSSSQRARVEKFLDARAAKLAQKFHRHWTRVFDAPGRENWWAVYLSREVRRPSRRKPT